MPDKDRAPQEWVEMSFCGMATHRAEFSHSLAKGWAAYALDEAPTQLERFSLAPQLCTNRRLVSPVDVGPVLRQHLFVYPPDSMSRRCRIISSI